MKNIIFLQEQINDDHLTFSYNLYQLDNFMKSLKIKNYNNNKLYGTGSSNITIKTKKQNWGMVCNIGINKLNDIKNNYNDMYSDSFIDLFFNDHDKYIINNTNLENAFNIFIKPNDIYNLYNLHKTKKYDQIKKYFSESNYVSTMTITNDNIDILQEIERKFNHTYICDNIYPYLWTSIIAFNDKPEIVLDTWIPLYQYINKIQKNIYNHSKFYCNRFLTNKYSLNVCSKEYKYEIIKYNKNKNKLKELEETIIIDKAINVLSIDPLKIQLHLTDFKAILEYKAYLPNSDNIYEYIIDFIPNFVYYDNDKIVYNGIKCDTKFQINVTM